MRQQKTLFTISFLAPSFLLYTVFIVLPIAFSIYISLTQWSLGNAPDFVGLKNFQILVADPDYWTVLKNTLILAGASAFIQVPLALGIAYLLTQIRRGFRLLRTVYFLPVVISPLAIGVMFGLIYNGNVGPLNPFLSAVGLGALKRNWLSDRSIVLYAVITPQVWQYIGLFVIIFVAGLRSIPREIFESARIDGASSFHIFFLIVVPLLREIIAICVILAVTGSLRSFDHSWAIARGGPGVASAYLATLMYKSAFLRNTFGYASAITLTIAVYSLSFSILFRRFFVKNTVQY